MTSVNRERALETKLSLLERRLVLVERFVEMRFCESFRDFSFRHDESLDIEDRSRSSINRSKVKVAESILPVGEEGNDGDFDERESPFTPTRTRSGRSTKRPARLSASVTEPLTNKRSKIGKEPEEKLQVTRVESTQEDNEEEETPVTPVTRNKTSSRTAAVSPLKSVAKSGPLSEDVTVGGDEDEYFTFPHDEDGQHDKASNGADDDDNDYCLEREDDEVDNVESDLEYDAPQPKKRKSAPSTPTRVTRTRRKKGSPAITPGSKLVLANSVREECSVCHKYFRKELIPSHMEFHTKERHLKCSYCDKRFFNKSMVMKHEKLHQPEKYAKKCRLCDKTAIESGKMLVHERSCIRRALEQNKHVDPELIDEIRRRSQGIDLKWPDQTANDPNKKKCTYCPKFIRVSDYPKHLKIHATWVCTLCDNSYINKEGLVKHMRNIHGATGDDGKSGGEGGGQSQESETTAESQDDKEEPSKTAEMEEPSGENDVEMDDTERVEEEQVQSTPENSSAIS